METIKIDGLRLSRLCLGGGKMVEMSIDAGKELVRHAIELGINIFDAHHRYGNCEEILGHFPQAIKMAKVSAYEYAANVDNLLANSSFKMKDNIEIYWVSDLDDEILYERGRNYYEKLRDSDITVCHDGTKLKGRVQRLGITTESPEIGFKFLAQYPECAFFMIPFHFDVRDGMYAFISALKKQGKYVFAIKPFNDFKGSFFQTYRNSKCIGKLYQPIKLSLKLCIDRGVDIICFGTKDAQHLQETVEIFNSLTGKEKGVKECAAC